MLFRSSSTPLWVRRTSTRTFLWNKPKHTFHSEKQPVGAFQRAVDIKNKADKSFHAELPADSQIVGFLHLVELAQNGNRGVKFDGNLAQRVAFFHEIVFLFLIGMCGTLRINHGQFEVFVEVSVSLIHD